MNAETAILVDSTQTNTQFTRFSCFNNSVLRIARLTLTFLSSGALFSGRFRRDCIRLLKHAVALVMKQQPLNSLTNRLKVSVRLYGILTGTPFDLLTCLMNPQLA